MADMRKIRLPNGQTFSLRDDGILMDTTANWNKQPQLQSQVGYIYIYTDYKTVDGNNIPGIKIGDGNAYLIDLEFLDELYARHINDNVIHVTQSEKNFWNNKVNCFIAPEQDNKLVFSRTI